MRGVALAFKALGLWCAFVALAVVVSACRTTVLLPRLGELRAHQVATLLLVGLVAVAIALFVRVTALALREAVRVGLLWFGLSVLAEFVLLHYGAGISWERLLADYDLRRGRLFALVPLVELLAPMIFAKACRSRRGPAA